MKKLTIAITLIIVALAVHAAPPLVSLTVAWQDTNAVPVLDHYVPQTNDCYLLIGTNNVNAPIGTWPVLAVYTNWTLGTNNGVWYTNTISVAPGPWFFGIITSNFWGSAVPSNVAQTGPASTPSVNLGLSR